MLEKANKHINDNRISFDEANHDYFVDGKKIKFSVTEIIDKFFPKFDKAYWAERKAKEKLDQDHVHYDSEILNSVIKQILDSWEKKRVDAASKGTMLHEKIEDFYNSKFHDDYPPEFEYFQNFHKKYKRLKPYRTEWRIFDKHLSLAGTVDMVYEKENGELFIFDWKRTSKLVDENNQPILKDFNFGYEGLSQVADNSYNRYALQQNVYKYIIENHYQKIISSMNLLVLHPDYNDFIHLKLPDMKKEAEFLIDQAKALSK